MPSTGRSEALRKLAFVNGGTCAAIGVAHVLKGADITAGVGLDVNANVDSQEAFYGGIFAGYGAAWIWAARQPRVAPEIVRFLAGTMALGGVGRVLSMRRRGLPHPFWTALTGVEFIVPALLVWLAETDRT